MEKTAGDNICMYADPVLELTLSSLVWLLSSNINMVWITLSACLGCEVIVELYTS